MLNYLSINSYTFFHILLYIIICIYFKLNIHLYSLQLQSIKMWIVLGYSSGLSVYSHSTLRNWFPLSVIYLHICSVPSASMVVSELLTYTPWGSVVSRIEYLQFLLPLICQLSKLLRSAFFHTPLQ